eukprot:TRINITY_DN6726_c0_g1_i1.p1 TRINITY_DN6726_c0_g1~~TRINITY_DN6726_c0_g1_i1.p1  ORF type:complete len:188 (+),score=60.03 TRINITY_DN6726_c0_g1_i1:21-584(+)
MLDFYFFFFKQKTAYEMLRSLVGSEMCIRDRLKSCPEYGVFEMRVMDLATGQPAVVVVDDFVPTVDGVPAMCHCSQAGAHLYYKAVAKLAGSYSSLQFCNAVASSCVDSLGRPARALHALLGLTEEMSFKELCDTGGLSSQSSPPVELDPPCEVESFRIMTPTLLVAAPSLEFTMNAQGVALSLIHI